MSWENLPESFIVFFKMLLIGSGSLIHQVPKETYHVGPHVFHGLLVIPRQISIRVEISQRRVIAGVVCFAQNLRVSHQ